MYIVVVSLQAKGNINTVTIMKKTITVNGMKCEHCKAKVEGALKAIDGVHAAEVSLADHNVAVDYDETKVQPEAMKEAVDNAGHVEMVL